MTLRGIYHAHSRYSLDGHFTLRELKEALEKRGFSFAIMTEHAEDMTPESLRAYCAECQNESDEGFLFIPGLEVPYLGKVHVGCFPVTPRNEVPMYHDGIKAMHDDGGITILHHPSKESYFIDERLPALIDGVEVWNSRYEGTVVPSSSTISFAETHFRDAIVFGGLDIHTRHQFGGPHIALEVPELSQEHIITAIRNRTFRIEGRFYSFDNDSYRTAWHRSYRTLMRIVYTALRWIRALYKGG